jgi:hypothetical protein
MSNGLSLSELIPILNNNHFYPDKEITLGKDEKQILSALLISCIGIGGRDKLLAVKKVLPDNFTADYFPNQEHIRIVEK